MLALPAVIGRGREADLTMPHPLVSREHCRLFERDGRLYVRDLGSTNGTYVGQRRVSEAEVPEGELLTVGSVTLRVDLPTSVDLADAKNEAHPNVFAADAVHGPDAGSEPKDACDTSDFPAKHFDLDAEASVIDRETTSQSSERLRNSEDDLPSFLDSGD